MTTREILIAAKAKIDTPEKWAQGCEARDANGDPCGTKTPVAVRRCTIGAVNAVTSTCADANAALRAISAVANTHLRIMAWNDHPDRTHAEIMAAFDRAIEACNG
mgnify:CR=1 FL=1